MGTREHILRYLKRHPGATVRELAQSLGMTQANVRHHLSSLEEQGLVVAQSATEGTPPQRGRPAKRYYLTAKALPVHLEPLTRALLEYLRALDIPLTSLCPFLCGQEPPSGPLRQRLKTALAFFQERAYHPRWEARREGPHILFDQCPYGLLSRDFPELCELDKEVLSHLLGVPVEPVQVGPTQPICIFALHVSLSPSSPSNSRTSRPPSQ